MESGSEKWNKLLKNDRKTQYFGRKYVIFDKIMSLLTKQYVAMEYLGF